MQDGTPSIDNVFARLPVRTYQVDRIEIGRANTVLTYERVREGTLQRRKAKTPGRIVSQDEADKAIAQTAHAIVEDKIHENRRLAPRTVVGPIPAGSSVFSAASNDYASITVTPLNHTVPSSFLMNVISTP